MKITTLDTFPAELDGVALESPHATFYHSGAWLKSVAAAYPRMDFRCLVAEDAGSVVGYLPFFVSRKGPLGRAWSLPFGTYGGPVCIDDAVLTPLLEEYSRILSRPGFLEVGWVDFGNIAGGDETETRYQCHLVDLTVGYDRLFAEGYATQRRQRVRRAEKLGVTVRRESGAQDLETYYEIFRDKIAAFGRESLYNETLYRELFSRGGDSVRLYLAHQDEQVVGGHLNFYYKNTVIAWYGVVAREFEQSQAGTALYSTCMRDACAEGFSVYNLGASLGKASLIHFKESLGGVAHPYPVHVTHSLLGRLARLVRPGGTR